MPEEGGTVTGGGFYKSGERAPLVATANPGWQFVGWVYGSGRLNSLENPYQCPVACDTHLYAKFIPAAEPTPAPPMGKITVLTLPKEGGTVTGAGTYKFRENFVMEATPNLGWYFVGWSKNGQSCNAPAKATFICTGEDATYVACFKQYSNAPDPNDKTVLWEGKLGDNITGTLYGNMDYVISGTGATYNYKYDCPQNTTGSALLDNKNNVQRIIIEEGITEIGDQAFAWFHDCKQIVLPSTLTKIGEQSFMECGYNGYWDDVNEYLAPNDVTKLWYMKINFQDTKLTEIGAAAFNDTTIDTIVFPDTLKVLHHMAFYYAANSVAGVEKAQIVIPSSVKKIGQVVFNTGSDIVVEGKSSLNDFELLPVDKYRPDLPYLYSWGEEYIIWKP